VPLCACASASAFACATIVSVGGLCLWVAVDVAALHLWYIVGFRQVVHHAGDVRPGNRVKLKVSHAWPVVVVNHDDRDLGDKRYSN
jgi:hypothetical protein